MTKQIKLKDSNGKWQTVQQGESFNLPAVFHDAADPPVQLASDDILTLTVTLFAGTTIINSRDEQDILGVNGGTVSEAGALTLALDPADQAIVDGTLPAGALEKHIARIDWTWDDGTERTGRVEYAFWVEVLAAPEVPE